MQPREVWTTIGRGPSIARRGARGKRGVCNGGGARTEEEGGNDAGGDGSVRGPLDAGFNGVVPLVGDLELAGRHGGRGVRGGGLAAAAAGRVRKRDSRVGHAAAG
jgi:hypothetical protein